MAGTLFTQVNWHLQGLVDGIEMGQIGLPDLQRPFVWPNAKVRDLFDSMYKGYPVGYLLFWANGHDSGASPIGVDQKSVPPSLVIVDGQQRLTALYSVLKGKQVVRGDFSTERIHIAFNPLEGNFKVTSAAIQQDKKYIPDISIVWEHNADLFAIVRRYIEGLREAQEVTSQQEQAVQNAVVQLSNLNNYPLTALQLAPTASEEAVADVFVRINSQGKTLNQSDFILTLMSVFWDEGRTDLERFSRSAKSPSPNIPSPYNHFIEPSPDQLLRISVGLGFKRARLHHVYSILRGKDLETGDFSVTRREEQFGLLKAAQAKALNLLYWHDFLKCILHAGYRSGRMISSQNALLYAYVFYLIGRTEFHIKEAELRPAIAQWFFMAALTGRYTSSPESQVESDFAMLRDAHDGKLFLSRLRAACAIALTNDYWEVTLPNELATSAARSPSLFAYEASLVLLDAPALFSSLKVADMLMPDVAAPKAALERHHLFPRGHLQSLQITDTRDVNQIANFAYVEWHDNLSISDMSPAEYLPIQRQGFSNAQLTEMCQVHALPNGWEHMEYPRFLAARRELMAAVIREGYQRLVAGPQDPPVELDVAELVRFGESDAVEFKSTLRVNLHTGQRDPRMEHAIVRTLAGFLNASGGTLVIGVADDGTPVGLDKDEFENEDKMALHLMNLVNGRLGPVAGTALHPNFEDYEDGRALVVRCERSHVPVYMNDDGIQRFYVRSGPSTAELNISQATSYITQRFS